MGIQYVCFNSSASNAVAVSHWIVTALHSFWPFNLSRALASLKCCKNSYTAILLKEFYFILPKRDLLTIYTDKIDYN